MFGGLRRFKHRHVIVHAPPGPSIRGVLRHVYKDCVVIGHGHSLDDEADLAGDVIVPLSAGVWIQAVAPEAPK